MTKTELLLQKIEASGYKRRFIADKLGISYPALKMKVENEHEFKPSEIKVLCELLNISKEEMTEIFFSI